MTDYVLFRSWDATGMFLEGEGAVEILAGTRENWDEIGAVLARYEPVGPKEAPLFSGGAVGYITYEGEFWFGIYPELRRVPCPGSSCRWQERKASHHHKDRRAGSWELEISPKRWITMVEQAHEYIRSGDIYQVNLSHRMHAPFSGNPYELFEELLAGDPAPGAAFFETPKLVLLSASPELFLRVEGSSIVTRPIKGTRPRGQTPEEDQRLAEELASHSKELAELIMITDLERNDLGVICQWGTVRAPKVAELESFAFVHHLVSTVEGQLRPGTSVGDILRACFPGGSVTGAPKKRAMEIIRELEQAPRGIYTGAFGMIGFQGEMVFTMGIRILVWDGTHLWLQVGSGITIDSESLAEYKETLDKARGLQEALSRWEKGKPNANTKKDLSFLRSPPTPKSRGSPAWWDYVLPKARKRTNSV
ncbi:anthranilate synthase component I family protein [Candidatus Methylacidithermus pantelleriae]|uniref:Aminodeoxychorismate synthase, component I n=1 Tax=Candidatus Methylacidithermus pantelleriae TaxID=2744239 RepID=A0A8J2BU07_9BACT|nr:anthranilate synthase component I family protein [Candidatus Methylacidithermus pantelleriae]CAF0698957.1 Aminodeoxychorismate synthase, component I [Candidatus Methylacidithermus pantelleriae]